MECYVNLNSRSNERFSYFDFVSTRLDAVYKVRVFFSSMSLIAIFTMYKGIFFSYSILAMPFDLWVFVTSKKLNFLVEFKLLLLTSLYRSSLFDPVF